MLNGGCCGKIVVDRKAVETERETGLEWVLMRMTKSFP